MRFFERYQAILHVVGWLVFIGLPFLTLPGFLFNPQDLFSMGMAQLLTTALIITYFYANLRRLTPNLLGHNSNGLSTGLSLNRFVLIMAGMLLSVVLMRYACYQLFPPSFVVQQGTSDGPLISRPFGTGVSPRDPKPGPHSPWPGALSSGISFGFAMMVSSLMALFRFHARSQEVQQQMALEKISAELAMLKLQVSPHFLFNTLNNIRWLARKKSDQTETAVVTLAQLLRYMIYQARQDRVSLRQEIEHLKHYIDLQKMRLTEIHTVSFTCEGDLDRQQIEPLLFIPFVENAFKYGIHGQKPSHIRIWLTVTDEQLTFGVENPVFDVPTVPKPVSSEETGSGIGIENVRHRLRLHYPDQHALTLTNANNRFRVLLTLHLAHD
ncbi:sensor histidine kinase [Spirosoma montaniterrae]|uniref:Sensor protein lytS n=1 Tax=Spirosoma montaniterrae TaxID=1178516 RepID=A0A1P9WUH1_9BACT|nr:sensor histidine kinase [Spirosoma montaniterrae]AQG78983.1 sensor protein lytS [Spirosoma montaniterrae]